jgi:hypothetical protein
MPFGGDPRVILRSLELLPARRFARPPCGIGDPVLAPSPQRGAVFFGFGFGFAFPFALGFGGSGT